MRRSTSEEAIDLIRKHIQDSISTRFGQEAAQSGFSHVSPTAYYALQMCRNEMRAESIKGGDRVALTAWINSKKFGQIDKAPELVREWLDATPEQGEKYTRETSEQTYDKLIQREFFKLVTDTEPHNRAEIRPVINLETGNVAVKVRTLSGRRITGETNPLEGDMSEVWRNACNAVEALEGDAYEPATQARTIEQEQAAVTEVEPTPEPAEEIASPQKEVTEEIAEVPSVPEESQTEVAVGTDSAFVWPFKTNEMYDLATQRIYSYFNTDGAPNFLCTDIGLKDFAAGLASGVQTMLEVRASRGQAAYPANAATTKEIIRRVRENNADLIEITRENILQAFADSLNSAEQEAPAADMKNEVHAAQALAQGGAPQVPLAERGLEEHGNA